MAYDPNDYRDPENPDDPDPAATWIRRHVATAPPLSDAQRRHFAHLLSHLGDA